MATLPRVRSAKYSANNVSSPFSTSPRHLQEMSLPVPEGNDLINASVVSLKQYEEQLNSLRKENFHLKLRIYFLEEKLGTGAPPAVQGLLEHNVRLQVEVEELKRQLSDKQELLAAAAEAIDVLENQGSISGAGVETAINNSIPEKTEKDASEKDHEACDEHYQTESAGEYSAITVNNEDLDQLTRLRTENRKALQMIKGMMKKIQQQDKEIKKLKLNKELSYAHVSDNQMEKYEEMLKCKDEHIRDLENKIRQLQNNIDTALQNNMDSLQNEDASGNLHQLLTRRLQGLTYFLDKLLSHKCVLGEEKQKLVESILEQSLALPVGLQLDESMAPGELTMDESNLDISQSMRIEDLTLMFGHHMTCSDDNNRYSLRKAVRPVPQADVISESECWSEPDRNVSLARVGLCDTGVMTRELVSDNNRYRSRRSKVSYGSRSEDSRTMNENVLLQQINDLSISNQQLESRNIELSNKLETTLAEMKNLVIEKDELKVALADESSKYSNTNKELEIVKNSVLLLESRLKENEQQNTYNTQLIEVLRAEKRDMEENFLETERSLSQAADEATLQASQAALERTRAQHDKLKLERQLEETREKLANALEANCQLEIDIARKIAIDAEPKMIEVHERLIFDEDRPTSPDQGIDSDRLSSLEHNDAVNLSPRSLYQENITLKQKLSRTKATLAETLNQLNAANMRKRSVQRAICREIHKTQGVLRKARDQLEHGN